MKKHIVFVWMGLLAAYMVEGAFAQGALQNFPPTKWWNNKEVIKRLNLSPDQQSKIEAIYTRFRRSLIDEKAEVDRRTLDYEELVTKNPIDETAALMAFDKLHEARTSLERSTFLMRIQILNQLSAEQLQQLEAISELLRQQKVDVNSGPGTSPPTPSQKKQGH
jgi:Spy/CpxP family protein refolding chaperone